MENSSANFVHSESTDAKQYLNQPMMKVATFEKSISAFRQIINKIFCLHKMERKETFYITDAHGKETARRIVFVCEHCGKITVVKLNSNSYDR